MEAKLHGGPGDGQEISVGDAPPPFLAGEPAAGMWGDDDGTWPPPVYQLTETKGGAAHYQHVRSR
jgi:hypothetical protein